MKLSPALAKTLLNLYPPYLGAGIKCTYISADWDELHIEMKVRWYNKNRVGTHFGGSLYSMVDPHLMLLLMQRLGKGYYVWDKSADIDFIKATTKPVKAIIKLSEARLEEIKANTANGDKFLPEFELDIINSDKELIARVNKTLYIKKKPAKK